jgi:hypothetical protein
VHALIAQVRLALHVTWAFGAAHALVQLPQLVT